MSRLSFGSRRRPNESEGRAVWGTAAKVSALSPSVRWLFVGWAGRSEGAAGSFARHSHEAEAGGELSRAGAATTASSPIASVDGGKDSTLPQQPHSADGRLAQQAREVDADLDFVVEQAEATSANESIPTIATKATKATFVLGRCVVMA